MENIKENRKQDKILIFAFILAFSLVFYSGYRLLISKKTLTKKSDKIYTTQKIDGTYIKEINISIGDTHGKVPIAVKVTGNYYTLAMFNDLLPNSWQEISGVIKNDKLYVGEGLVTPPIGYIDKESKTITIYSLTAPINIKLNNLILSKSK